MDWKKDCWSKESYQDFKNHLLQIAEEEYRKFNEKIIPCNHPILGIRMPVLRKLAKEIARGNWNSYLKVAKDDSHEEIMLQGMVIASVSPKIEFSEVFRYLQQDSLNVPQHVEMFLPKCLRHLQRGHGGNVLSVDIIQCDFDIHRFSFCCSFYAARSYTRVPISAICGSTFSSALHSVVSVLSRLCQ